MEGKKEIGMYSSSISTGRQLQLGKQSFHKQIGGAVTF